MRAMFNVPGLMQRPFLDKKDFPPLPNLTSEVHVHATAPYQSWQTQSQSLQAPATYHASGTPHKALSN
jgi:hypothetical protein